jgi:hypothetical protein
LARGLEGGTEGMDDTQKQKVEEHREVIKEKLETVKTERTEKLAAPKLERCEKRQTNINKIFSNATERNKKQLAVFQKIEDKVKAFYVSKKITVDGYDAAVANADEKEAAAVAAIEASEGVTFDCANADAAKPGAVIKEAMKSRHEALKAYRNAVKDLIKVVRQANGQHRADHTTSGSGETETSTGGGQ